MDKNILKKLRIKYPLTQDWLFGFVDTLPTTEEHEWVDLDCENDLQQKLIAIKWKNTLRKKIQV